MCFILSQKVRNGIFKLVQKENDILGSDLFS